MLCQNETTGVAVKQRNLQALLKRADLAADGGLIDTKLIAGPSEVASLRHLVEKPDLVPVHCGALTWEASYCTWEAYGKSTFSAGAWLRSPAGSRPAIVWHRPSQQRSRALPRWGPRETRPSAGWPHSR